MQKVDLLRQADIFYELPQEHLEKLAAVCREVTCQEIGEVIVEENTPSDELYIIVKGMVDIVLDPSTLGVEVPEGSGPSTITTLRPGQGFGEIGLVDRGLRSASAHAAAKQTQLLAISFVFYACIRQYLRGERGDARALGAGLLLFVATIVFDILVESGMVDFVLLSDFGLLPLAIVMSLRISNDIIRTEEELGRYRQSLENLVEERTAELESEIGERTQAEMTLRRHVEELAALGRISQLLATVTDLPQLAEALSSFPPSARAILEGLEAGGSVVQPDQVEAVAHALEADLSALMILLLPVAAALSRPQISGYRVGAVAATPAGESGWGSIYLGANVEFPREALGLTLHAEQAVTLNAVFEISVAVA